jgi:hypothetical protein
VSGELLLFGMGSGLIRLHYIGEHTSGIVSHPVIRSVASSELGKSALEGRPDRDCEWLLLF